nr:MAG TPA: hypothetical protein [Caudoviricetes sp.]
MKTEQKRCWMVQQRWLQRSRRSAVLRFTQACWKRILLRLKMQDQ